MSALIVIDEPTATFSSLPEPFEITTFTFFSSLGIDKSNISLFSLSKCLWQIKQSLWPLMPSLSVLGAISSIQEEYEWVPYPKSISNVWTSKAGLVKGLLSICLLPFVRQVG